MDECPLSVHHVKLPVEPLPGLLNGCCVGEAADSTGHLGKVTPGHNSGGLVVDANLRIKSTVPNLKGSYKAFPPSGLTLNPVGHQSTTLMLAFCFSDAMHELTSFGMTSPL